MFGKRPRMTIEITEDGELGKFTLSVHSDLYVSPPQGFSSVETNVPKTHVFTRAIGQGSKAEIKHTIEDWLRQEAAYVPSISLERGTKINIQAAADIRVRNHKSYEDGSF